MPDRVRALLSGASTSLRAARDEITDGLWESATAAQVLAELDSVGALVVALRSRVLAAVEASQAWAGRGDRDAVAWRSRTSRQGTGTSLGQLRAARALAAMPRVGDALVDGELTPAHLDRLARVAASASDAVGAVLTSPQGQAEVLRLARQHEAGRFGTELNALAAGLDPAAVQAGHDAQRAARFLVMTHTPEATLVKGRLDPWAGKKLRLALEAVGGQPAADDDRTADQRAADALEALAVHALDTPPTRLSTERPHVCVLVEQETWAALRQPGVAAHGAGARPGAAVAGGAADGGAVAANSAGGAAFAGGETASAAGATPAAVAGGATAVAAALVGCAPVRDLDGVVLAPAEVGRLLCDCELSRLVLGADAEVLDLGRTTRLYAGALRRAVLVRDGGCAWPGCSTPARYGEVHHIAWWSRDSGGTSADNGVALCAYHHHWVHRHDLAITRTRPSAGAPPGRPARAPQRGRPVARYEFRRPDGTVAATSADGETGRVT